LSASYKIEKFPWQALATASSSICPAVKVGVGVLVGTKVAVDVWVGAMVAEGVKVCVGVIVGANAQLDTRRAVITMMESWKWTIMLFFDFISISFDFN
jgi:hypothetical protein